MLEYIKNSPVEAGFSEYKLPISIGSKEIGVQDIDSGDVIIDMGMWRDYRNGKYAGTMSISYDLRLEEWNGGIHCKTLKKSYGEDPKDAAAITWNTDMWNAISTDRFEATITGGEVETYDPFQTGKTGHHTGKAGFRVDDLSVSKNWKDPGFLDDGHCISGDDEVYAGMAGVILRPTGNYDRDERLVKGGYSHAYDASSPTVGGTLSIPPSAGVTISNTNEQIKENTVIRDKNGDEIEAYQHGATRRRIRK